MADSRCVSFIVAPAKVALLSTAPLMSASETSAPVKLAPVRSMPMKMLPFSLGYEKSAYVRSKHSAAKKSAPGRIRSRQLFCALARDRNAARSAPHVGNGEALPDQGVHNHGKNNDGDSLSLTEP